MSAREVLRLFRRAGQPVTPLLDGAPCEDLDIDRLVAAGQKRLVQLRPDVLDGDRLAIVQASHSPDVAVRSPDLAPATVVIHAAAVTNLWLLSKPIDAQTAGALSRLAEGRLGGAAWRSVPAAPVLLPGTLDLRWSRPRMVDAAGSGKLVDPAELLGDTHGRGAVAALLAGTAVAA